MGYWGVGNFDGDDPLDFLGDLVESWARMIDLALAGQTQGLVACLGLDVRVVAIEGVEAVDRFVMPLVEVLLATAERVPDGSLPSADRVGGWSDQALAMFDQNHHSDWESDPERRRAIAEAFDRLGQIALQRDPDKSSGSD